MECAICLKVIYNSVSLPCLHHFCKNCIIKWCHQKDSCPKCRKFIYFIKYDPEFDELNNKIREIIFKVSFSPNSSLENLPINLPISDTNSFDPQKIKFCSIDLSQSNIDYIGLTLSSNYKNNIIVTKINPKGLAALSGIKKKSILLSINEIPCISHQQTIKIIDFCKIIRENIEFKIVLPPSPLARVCGQINTIF